MFHVFVFLLCVRACVWVSDLRRCTNSRTFTNKPSSRSLALWRATSTASVTSPPTTPSTSSHRAATSTETRCVPRARVCDGVGRGTGGRWGFHWVLCVTCVCVCVCVNEDFIVIQPRQSRSQNDMEKNKTKEKKMPWPHISADWPQGSFAAAWFCLS